MYSEKDWQDALTMISDMREALRLGIDLFKKDHAIDRFDWSKSALRAEDIRELNETPLKLREIAARADEFLKGKP